MPPVARVADRTACPALFILPHVGGPLFNASPVHVQADGLPVVRLGDYAFCLPPAPLDVVAEGAATFTVCGLPVARVGDKMIHTGLIIEGSPTVTVGGATFSMPSNVSVNGPASFQNAVIRDMFFLSNTPTGKTILDGIKDSGQPVVIEPTDDPHNSFAMPDDGDDATNGTGTGTTVSYNPTASVYVQDINGNWIPQPPQTLFAHELIHAYHNANGTNTTNDADPNAPVSHPGIPKEEAQTIGTGSYEGGNPTENSLRADLGLTRRDNWWIRTTDDAGNELTTPTADMRPGNC